MGTVPLSAPKEPRTHHFAPGHEDLIAALRLDAPLPARHLALRVETEQLVAAVAVAAAGARRLRRMAPKSVQAGAAGLAFQLAPVFVGRKGRVLLQHVIGNFLPENTLQVGFFKFFNWIRFSQVVGGSECQCRSRFCPGLIPASSVTAKSDEASSVE
jgi:hypothetical protein